MSQADELDPAGEIPGAAEQLPAAEVAAWLGALEAALRPTQLDASLNERLIEMALEDPLASPSEQELVESARLRDALADGSAHADAALLRGLGAAFEPAADVSGIERAVTGALNGASKGGNKPRTNVVYVAFGAVSAALAAAAAAVLVLGSLSREAAPPLQALVKPHSTAPLFSERFDGDTTARMDAIASQRGRDLRDNRYAAWGVR